MLRHRPVHHELDERGMAFIIMFEGVENRAYRDSAGVWTIGIGHTAAAGPPVPTSGMVLSDREVIEVFRRDIRKYEAHVKRLVKVPITHEQYCALVSFCFNVGPGNFERSSMLRELNAGNYHRVPAKLMLWVKATVNGKKKTLRGLVRRRRAEGRLFSKGQWPKGIEPIIERFFGKEAHVVAVNEPATAVVKREQKRYAVEDAVETVKEHSIMNAKKIKGFIRHLATFIGGSLVALGYIDEATSQQVIGVIIAIGGFIASWLAPEKAEA